VHLVGFIIRIYNDARSSECQIGHLSVMSRLFLFSWLNETVPPRKYCS